MKALVKRHAKVGLWLEDVPAPTIGINDVLIKVLRTGICGTDVHIYNWDAWAQKTIPVPMVVGHEFVGQIVEVGSNVKDFHVGEIVSGTVRRFERSDVILDLGKSEAVLPNRERVPTEEYQIGERIRCFLKAIEQTPNGPEIILSRADPAFVLSLFRAEVAELKDGTIEIKLSNISAERRDDQVITTFDQTYNHPTYQDHTTKVLTWKKQADQWVIVAESNR